jgi:hypothetical protein
MAITTSNAPSSRNSVSARTYPRTPSTRSISATKPAGRSTGPKILSRKLRDRRAVARYAGLTGSPDESGLKSRERGLAKAGTASRHRRAVAGPAQVGAHSVLVQGPEGRPQADQRQERDRLPAADVPRGVPQAPVHPAGGWILRVDGDQGRQAAVRDCHEGPIAVRYRRGLGELEEPGGRVGTDLRSVEVVAAIKPRNALVMSVWGSPAPTIGHQK